MAVDHVVPTPNPWMILPFGLLLGSIALGPLVAAKWWSKQYPKVSFVLGAITVTYYLLGLHASHAVLETGEEYIKFVALVGSLFVVSGGIHITVKGEGTPFANTLFLAFGAIIANVLGTTGASMLLIRPWIRFNRYRITRHHIVFFIFIVSNVGGCLTPIGDPPLFLGYLKGVPFWWVAEHCWPMWAVGLGVLLCFFFAVDLLNYRRAPKSVRAQQAEPMDTWQFSGGINLLWLAVLLGSVFISNPPFLREGLMLGAAIGSYFTTPKRLHQANDFNFHPVQEVAILFVGIFATMMPALHWLQLNAGSLGTLNPSLLYWGSGLLSSVLDNAPTYLSFLSAIFGAFIEKDLLQQVQHLVETGGTDLATFVHGPHSDQIKATFAALKQYHPTALASKSVTVEQINIAFLLGNLSFNSYILAISIGSVFFGACTYIGNGPNFMVKAIADQQQVRTPSFLTYIVRYSIPFMGPMLLTVWWVFFR